MTPLDQSKLVRDALALLRVARDPTLPLVTRVAA